MKTRVRAWIDVELRRVVARRSRVASAGRQPQSDVVARRLRAGQGAADHGSRERCANASTRSRTPARRSRPTRTSAASRRRPGSCLSHDTSRRISCGNGVPWRRSANSWRGPPLTVALEHLDRYLAEYEPKLSALVADEDFRQETPPITSIMVRPYLIAAVGIRSRVYPAARRHDVAWVSPRAKDRWQGNRRHTTVARRLVVVGTQRSPGASTTAGDAKLGTQPRIAAHDQHAKPAARAVATEVPPALPRQRRRHWPSSRPPNHRVAVYGTCGAVDRGVRRAGQTCSAESSSRSIWRTAPFFALGSDSRRTGSTHEPRIDVEFEDHRQLGLLVPTRMDETFLIHLSAAGTGRATYSNFRRFQTSARIVPQP